MKTITKLLKSRQFWTLVVLFVMNGVTGVHDFIPANLLPIVDTVLGFLVVYFRISPQQKF